MEKLRIALLATAACLVAAGAAVAQKRQTQAVQVVAPGTVVLVVPTAMMALPPGFDPWLEEDTGPAIETSVADEAMPPPLAVIRQIDAMMAHAQQAFAGQGLMARDRGVASVVVTSFSDGRGSCTRRITDSGDGSAPKVEVSGDRCGNAGIPAALPDAIQPRPQTPSRAVRTLEVRNHANVAPIQVASAR